MGAPPVPDGMYPLLLVRLFGFLTGQQPTPLMQPLQDLGIIKGSHSNLVTTVARHTLQRIYSEALPMPVITPMLANMKLSHLFQPERL